MDFAHGTSKGKDVFEDAKAEAEKHDVKERASNKIDDGASLIQNSVEALTGNGNSSGQRRSGRKRTPKKGD